MEYLEMSNYHLTEGIEKLVLFVTKIVNLTKH